MTDKPTTKPGTDPVKKFITLLPRQHDFVSLAASQLRGLDSKSGQVASPEHYDNRARDLIMSMILEQVMGSNLNGGGDD